MDRKPIEDVIFEINNFISLGGRTIVDATGSESIGRDAQALREVALKTGLNIVASSGPYLEKFESQRIHKTVDELAATIDKELNQGIGDTDIRAGMIGEIGVSPTFTEAEHNSLRAASLAQINNPHVAMNIHMPGWLRRGDEVLDIVLGEMGVSPNKVSLAHSDPSGKDVAYQRKMLDKGVWLEFDMIGLDITFPKEGISQLRPLLPVHPGNAGQPAMPSGGDEHSVRAAPSHEYVAARRGCICRSWLNLRMVHTE